MRMSPPAGAHGFVIPAPAPSPPPPGACCAAPADAGLWGTLCRGLRCGGEIPLVGPWGWRCKEPAGLRAFSPC